MRAAQINVTCGAGSTGKICVGISRVFTDNKIENKVFFASGNSGDPDSEKYMGSTYTKIQALKSRVLGNYGFNSKLATKRLVLMLRQYDPDVVILHNLHGHNCNLKMLFSYLKEDKKKVVWVFHDCWAFTGYCTHYDRICCDKWQSECSECPLKREYSWFFDRCSNLFNQKRSLLNGLDLTVVTPSLWLEKQVRSSFLSDTPVHNIPNGIDISVFCPRESNFREKYNCKYSFIVLGVSYIWNENKGIDVFVKLAKTLPDGFQIVLIGTDSNTESMLPENVIAIRRTGNQKELAEIYSAADVFVNPTREDNYPTVNMEANACSTPVITFDTGGSGEMLTNKTGIVIKKNDFDSLFNAIIDLSRNSKFNRDEILNHAQTFSEKLTYQKYLDLVLGLKGNK